MPDSPIRTICSSVPKALAPLLRPARYKGAAGGRGAAKSHFFAERLLTRAYTQSGERPFRAVCIREVQQSLRDSCRQLLADKIQSLGMGDRFEVLDSEIRRRGVTDSQIIFRGMQSYNAETIKSLEGYDVAWVEEAQTLSQKSLKLLRPTIRNPGSELWFSWNPRHRTDPVDMLFRGKNRPSKSEYVFVTWKDNPWFPDDLRGDMEDDYRADPEDAAHVWGGGYGVGHGSILGRQIDAAEREGRIHDDVEFDPESPIEISSDIGFRDTATWWFWQRRIGGYALLDYDGDSGLDAEEWIVRLQDRLRERDWPLGKLWLPHDAKIKTFQTRHSAIEQFLKAFGSSRVGLVPRSSKSNRVNAARTIVKRCEFHKTRCEDGLVGLRNWEFEWNEELQDFSKEPKHDWASHPADGFSYGCQVMQELAAPPAPPKVRKTVGVEPDAVSTMTLDELWELERDRKRGKRI